jgi:ATP-dependent RNA helicase DDX3X
MADQLNVAALSLNESQHAPQGGPGGFERSTYIPPHMRSSGGRPDPGPGPGPGPIAAQDPLPNGNAAPGATQLNGNAPGFNRNG